MAKEFNVNPWDVKGEVDYNRLVKEFGVEKISPELLKRLERLAGESHFMLKRGIFFVHRDLKWLLDQYENGNPFFLYTGRGPSGKMHLGHLLPLVFTKWLQERFNAELWFQFTDDEKFLFDQKLDFPTVDKYLHENMLDIIALGFDPEKTHFLIDTRHAHLMYKEACKVAKKITFSMVRASFGFNEQSNIGSIFYTSMQAVPAFLPSVLKGKNIPCLIPHAIDQDPHFRLTRDILPRLGYFKPASIQCPFLPPLTGMSGKMSSSIEESAIYTTDTPKEVEKKINKYAFSGGQATIDEHRKKGGNTKVDIPFQYLRMFFEPNDQKLKRIEEDYASGSLLTGELKQITIDKINVFLASHHEKRKSAENEISRFIYAG
jgi:tryptophanyl-tRNA synthetase